MSRKSCRSQKFIQLCGCSNYFWQALHIIPNRQMIAPKTNKWNLKDCCHKVIPPDDLYALLKSMMTSTFQCNPLCNSMCPSTLHRPYLAQYNSTKGLKATLISINTYALHNLWQVGSTIPFDINAYLIAPVDNRQGRN